MKDSIANRLKTFRLSKKATQKDMASALCCTIPTYNRYERGVAIIGTKDLESLYYMGCNLSWLITGKENMDISESKNENDLVKIIHNQSEALLNSSEAAKKTSDVLKEQTSIIEKILATKS